MREQQQPLASPSISLHASHLCACLPNADTANGGLVDPGHCDVGSTFTLSVQLSEPGAAEEGGRFSTTDSGGVLTMHELARGDAILFASEQVRTMLIAHVHVYIERRNLIW